MTPAADLLAAARRVWLGAAGPGDDAAVLAAVAGRPKAPADPGRAALWVPSRHAAANAPSRYRSVREWVDRGGWWLPPA